MKLTKEQREELISEQELLVNDLLLHMLDSQFERRLENECNLWVAVFEVLKNGKYQGLMGFTYWATFSDRIQIDSKVFKVGSVETMVDHFIRQDGKDWE